MRHLLPILLSLTVFTSNAQSWCPPGAEWTYNYQWFAASGYYKIQYEKDTVVTGQPCQKLSVKKQIRGMYPPSVDTSFAAPIYTYENADTVYFLRGNAFYPVYYFAAKVGDTLYYENVDLWCGRMPWVVDSVGTVVINNKAIRFYTASPHSSYYWRDSIGPRFLMIERLGCPQTYIQPEIVCYSDPEGISLRCYSDNLIGTYEADTSIACDYFYTSIEDPDRLNFNIYPNPAQSYITIDNGVIAEYKIWNTLAETILQGTIQRNGLIDINSIASGCYTISVSQNKKHSIKRFIKL